MPNYVRIKQTLAFICLGLVLHAIGRPVDMTQQPQLVSSIKTSPTQLDSLQLLASDAEWTFDYSTHEYYTFAPGGVVNANAATFPATVGNGITMAWISLGPCAMLPPHYHPRGSNYVVATMGETQTFMVMENGARVVRTTLSPGKMTLFPLGSLHTMQNMGCENATLISALSSDDAGTHNVANGLFKLPLDMVAAAFGHNPLLARFVELSGSIPDVGTGAATGSAECLARCGLTQGKG